MRDGVKQTSACLLCQSARIFCKVYEVKIHSRLKTLFKIRRKYARNPIRFEVVGIKNVAFRNYYIMSVHSEIWCHLYHKFITRQSHA